MKQIDNDDLLGIHGGVSNKIHDYFPFFLGMVLGLPYGKKNALVTGGILQCIYLVLNRVLNIQYNNLIFPNENMIDADYLLACDRPNHDHSSCT